MSERSAGRKRHSPERATRASLGKRASRVFVVLRDAAEGFIDHRDLTLAASIAYYTALSLAPLLVLGLWPHGEGRYALGGKVRRTRPSVYESGLFVTARSGIR